MDNKSNGSNSNSTEFDLYSVGDKVKFINKKIKEIIYSTPTFIVFIDETDTIQWTNNSNHEYSAPSFGKISNKISFWEAVANRVCNKNVAYMFKCLLAEGYARILDYEEGDDHKNHSDEQAAMEVVNETAEKIKIIGRERMRLIYIASALATTILVVAFLGYCLLNKSYIIGLLGSLIYPAIMCALYGGIGAFISSFINSRKYETEILASKMIHGIDGFLRVFYGLIAGAIIYIAIKSHILFSFLDEKGMDNGYVLYLIGFIGGASEALIPSIINIVEKKAQLGDDKAKNG